LNSIIQFIHNVKRVFKILNNNKITREYVDETRKLIDEYEELDNIFKWN